MSRKAAVAGAILVGGRGLRLGGVTKPLLAFGGVPIIERQVAVLAPLVGEVLIVGGDDARYSGYGRVVPDLRPGHGPLAGLEAALAATTAETVLLVGGDMPALHPEALALVLSARPSAAAAVPRTAARPEPLHARYSRHILPEVRARLDRGELALRSLLDSLDVEYLDETSLRGVDPTLSSLANVNTPDDLARLTVLLDHR